MRCAFFSVESLTIVCCGVLVSTDHSCDANVSRVRVGRQMVFFAARDIHAGEECTITYSSRGAAERRVFLREHYGFNCECALCARGEDVRQPSARCVRCGCERWDGGLCVVCDARRIVEILLDEALQ